MNNKLIGIASRTLDKTYTTAKQDYSDPLTIIIVVSLLLTLIRVLQECRPRLKKMSKEEKIEYLQSEIKKLSNKQGIITKYRVKKAIKQHLSKEQYKKYGQALYGAVLDMGKEINKEDTIYLMEARNV
jgi:hypothetical protein